MSLRSAASTPATDTMYVPRLKAWKTNYSQYTRNEIYRRKSNLNDSRNEVSRNLAGESNGQNHKTWMVPKVLAHDPPSPADYRAVSQGSATKSSIACALPSFHQFGRLRILLILINRLCVSMSYGITLMFPIYHRILSCFAAGAGIPLNWKSVMIRWRDLDLRYSRHSIQGMFE